MTNFFTFAVCAAIAFVLISPGERSDGAPSPNFFEVAAAYSFR